MAFFVATYTYVSRPQQLAALRPQRMTFFRELQARGALLVSGQLLDGELGSGLLVVQADDRQQAEQFLDGDPFVGAGLVEQRLLAMWHPTAGLWLDA